MKCFQLLIGTSLSYLVLCFAAYADTTKQESNTKETTEKANIIKFGEVEINSTTREISFPVTFYPAALKSEQIEFLVATNKGKLYEALFLTKIEPHNLKAALLLINLKTTNDIFLQIHQSGMRKDKLYKADKVKQKKSRLSVLVGYKKTGEKQYTKISPFQLLNAAAHNAKKHSGINTWVFTGSYLFNQKLAANLYGNVIAIRPDHGSIICLDHREKLQEPVYYINTKNTIVAAIKAGKKDTKFRIFIKPKF